MNELIPLLQQLVGHDAVGAVEFLTDWGGPLGWWIVLQLVFVLADSRRGLQLSIVMLLALATNSWLKWLIAEPRPFFVEDDLTAFRTTPGFGMPSGHAQGAAAFLGLLALQFRAWLIPLVLLILLVGLTRIYLGVHSPAQVLVGWLLGVALVVLVHKLWPKLSATVGSWAFAKQLLGLALATVVLLAITQAVLAVMAGFVVPEAWIAGYARTAGVVEANADDLHLFSDGVSLLVMLGAGYVLVAMLDQRWPMALTGVLWKVAAILACTLVTLLFLSAFSDWLGVNLVSAGLALVQPIVCLWAPARLLHLAARRRQSIRAT